MDSTDTVLHGIERWQNLCESNVSFRRYKINVSWYSVFACCRCKLVWDVFQKFLLQTLVSVVKLS
jgi:hypothetical protein